MKKNRTKKELFYSLLFLVLQNHPRILLSFSRFLIRNALYITAKGWDMLLWAACQQICTGIIQRCLYGFFFYSCWNSKNRVVLNVPPIMKVHQPISLFDMHCCTTGGVAPLCTSTACGQPLYHSLQKSALRFTYIFANYS